METGPSAQTQPQSYQELPGAESPPAPRLGGGLRRSLREDPSGTQPAPNWGSPSRQGSPPLERCTLQGAPGEQAAPAPKQQSDKDNFCAPTCGQGFSRSCSHCPPPWMVASVRHLSVRGVCKLSVHVSFHREEAETADSPQPPAPRTVHQPLATLQMPGDSGSLVLRGLHNLPRLSTPNIGT